MPLISISLRYAIIGGLLAIVIHAFFFETGWHGENPYLHALDILSWILAAFFIGRMKEGWDRRTRELEYANAELQKQMEERQRAEQAMREREELFSDLFDNSRDMIQSIAPDGRTIYANRAWRENLGFAKNEVPGFPMFEVIHPDFHAHCMERFETLLSGDEVDKIETEFVTRDGRRILVEGKCNCKFVDGKPVAIRGIFRDITERRKLEIELQKAQKLEAIGILAGGIAHDFNNILTGLLAVISLVKSALPPENEQVEILEEARQTCLQGKELTGKFITFAEGGSPLKKCVNIKELLKQSVETALRGSGIEYGFALAEDIYNVLIDSAQMQQVINNVVINAREAMVNGGGVKVRAENQEIAQQNGLDIAPGAYLCISITDEGVGIPQENLAKIFDPYFTTKRMASQRGTGFGLAICYSIMRKHDGTITVESENGKGTTFHIYLPACF
ncbi:MAG: PAS domain S-box protein [Proteobacteria bacterium]|nr:PAS domain S-box protein [Pseudomonadota bacterium]